MENCWIEDRLWEEELRKFICTAQVVTAFKNLRIAQISVRPQRFMSVMVNEAELLEKFGIELVPVREPFLWVPLSGLCRRTRKR